MVDALFKWPQIVEISLTATYKIITEMHKMFAAYEFPAQVVSDKL